MSDDQNLTASPYGPAGGAPAPAAAVPSPPATAGPITPRPPRGTDAESVFGALALAALMLVLVIVNLIAASGFPYNAPVEAIMAFGISVDFAAVAIILVIRFLVIFRRPRSLAERRPGPGGLAVAAIVVAGISFLGWLALGGVGFLVRLLSRPDELRYLEDTAGLFYLGFVWVTGLVLGVIAYRRGSGTAHNALALTAVGLTLVLVIPTLFSGIAYGMGLTD